MIKAIRNWEKDHHPQPKPPFLAPQPVLTFVGRIKELDDLHGLLQKGQVAGICGLVGSGGIGKTELAKQYAHEYQAHYPGGIYWLSFDAEETMPLERAVSRMLKELGLPDTQLPSTREDAEAKLLAQISNKHALLILDNVVDPSQLVAHKEFSLIVTTRDHRLARIVASGQEMQLDALSLEESLELLAKKLGKDRVKNKKNQGAAKRIAELCGYMPLALDIVCSLILQDVPTRPLVDFIGYLQSESVLGKLKLHEGKDEKDKSVFTSLYASLEYIQTHADRFPEGQDLLKLFRAASVCAAEGFCKESAAAAGGVNPDQAGQLLTTLYDLNLLKRREQEDRTIHFLHPLVRELAFHEAGADQKEFRESALRYLDYFVNFTQTHKNKPGELVLSGAEIWQALVWANRLQEQDQARTIIQNLALPFQYYIAKGEAKTAYLFLRASRMINLDNLGFSRELASLLEALLALTTKTTLGDLYLADAAGRLGICYRELGKIEQAIAQHQRSGELCKKAGHRQGEASQLGNLGSCYFQKGDLEQAIQKYQEALKIDQEIGNRLDEANWLGGLGNCYRVKGEIEKAIQSHQQALVIDREIGNRQGEAQDLGSLGNCYFQKGDLDQAIQKYQEALKIHQEIGDRLGEALDLGNLGNCYAQKGDLEPAIQKYQEALKIHQEIGNRLGEANQLGNLGNCFMDKGQLEICLACWMKAFAKFEKIGARMERDQVGGWLAELMRELGEEKFKKLSEEVTGRLEELVERAKNWGKDSLE